MGKSDVKISSSENGLIFFLVGQVGGLEHGWILNFHTYIGKFIIPTDLNIFFRGVGRKTTNQRWFSGPCL